MNNTTTANRLGLVMFGLLPVIGSLKGLMIPANVTIIIPAAIFIVLLASRWNRLAPTAVPDAALVTLSAVLAARILFELNTVLALPAEYGMHLLALVIICPFMYYAGRIMGGGLDDQNLRLQLLFNLLVVAAFLGFNSAMPDFASRNGIEANSYYQFMGDGLAVCALIAWAAGYRPKYYWVYLLTALALVSIGSRASAVAFIAAMTLSNVQFVAIGTLLAVPTAWWVANAVNTGIGLDWTGQFRVLSTFLDVFFQDNEDASLSERQAFLDNALEMIQQSPFLGNLGYDFQNGETGHYAHNILHVWANFGLVPCFLMLLLMLSGPIVAMNSRVNRRAWQALPLFAFVCIEFFFFRQPENIVLFFALGVLTTFYADRNSASSAEYARKIVHAQ